MNENTFKRNELLAAKVIKGLESRNMTGYYAATMEEALKKALELIEEGSSVDYPEGYSLKITAVCENRMSFCAAPSIYASS